MGPVITDIRQCLVTVRYHRRTLVRPHWRHHIDPVGNPVCVGNDHFLCLVAAKISKLFQHLLRRPKIKGGLIVGIRKSLS